MTRIQTAFIVAATFFTAVGQAQTIGVNVVLNRPPDAGTLADLATHGKLLDVIPEINAVILRASASDVDAIAALPYVIAANADARRDSAGGAASDFSAGANLWNLDAINVTEFGGGRTVAYDGQGVYVAVIDSGLVNNWRDYFPEERIATQFARAFGGGGGDKGTVSTQPELWEHDSFSHGTAIASVILGFNYLGPEPLPAMFNGVAPMATVIPVKVRNNGADSRAWSSVLTRGLLYVVGLKVNGDLGDAPVVVNLSVQGTDPDYLERAAIDFAIANGVIVVAAAGNQGESGMSYPGAYPPVISVAATGWVREFPADDPSLLQWIGRDVAENDPLQHQITPFSGRELPGQELDVAAPGFGVPAAWTQDGRVDYTNFSGTSAACPHVVGVAALMLQKNPRLRQAAVEAIMNQTAMPLDPRCADIRVGFFASPQHATWRYSDTMFVFDYTACWGANATGHGLVQADAALAATPMP